MVPLKQKYRHNPAEGAYGDCHRTCLAMILELERDTVPNFAEHAHEQWGLWQDLVNEFLAEHGMGMFRIAFAADLDAVLHYMLQVNPGIFYILGGSSRNGTGHSVVCVNDKIIADPSLDDSGIVGPMEDGHFWIEVLVPALTVNRLNLPRPDLAYAGVSENE
jgi:hypothetical protein